MPSTETDRVMEFNDAWPSWAWFWRKTMNAKPTPRALARTAVTVTFVAATVVTFFNWAEISAQLKAPRLAREQWRLELNETFRATWEGHCVQTPAGRIGYPLASNFGGFLPPGSLDLDFREGSKASYDLNDLRAVDCPQKS